MVSFAVGCGSEKQGADASAGADDGGADAADSGVAADSGAEGCGEGGPLTWDSFGDGFFRTYCTACHSSTTPDRHGAPSGVDFDTERGAEAWFGRVRARALDAQTMPIGGGITVEDRALLDRYLCEHGS